MMREDDFLRHPGELAAASLFGTSPHHRDLKAYDAEARRLYGPLAAVNFKEV